MSTETQTPEIAASSPAASYVPPVEVEDFTHEQRETWTRTGELPAQKAQISSIEPKEPASATGAADEQAATSAQTAASEAATKPASEKSKRANGSDRKEELRGEINSLLERRAVLKEDDLWNEFSEWQASRKKTPETKQAASSTAPQAQARTLPVEPQRPKRPELTEFRDVAHYNLAMDTYEADLAKFSTDTQAYEAAKSRYEESVKAQEAQAKKAVEDWGTKVKAAKEKHADFDDVLKVLERQIPESTPIDYFIVQSEIGAEMLYYFGTHKDELKSIVALPWTKQERALIALEDKLTGTTVTEEKPKNTVTKALPPPREVSGQNAAALDEEDAALKNGDTDRYIELANARELRERKKRQK